MEGSKGNKQKNGEKKTGRTQGREEGGRGGTFLPPPASSLGPSSIDGRALKVKGGKTRSEEGKGKSEFREIVGDRRSMTCEVRGQGSEV
jgi:hypothetical protein